MQDIKKEYERLLKSEEFKNEGFLSGVFLMSDFQNLNDAFWQLDFYNEKTNLMISYLMEDKILLTENSEVFKEEKTKVKKINLNELKINFIEILNISNKIIEKKKENPVKIVIILQENESLIWNISYMTSKLNLVNIKISAEDGKILNESTQQLMSFSK